MKTLGFVLLILSFFLNAVGLIFKIQHWPGATISLLLGSAIFFPALLILLKYRNEDNSKNEEILDKE